MRQEASTSHHAGRMADPRHCVSRDATTISAGFCPLLLAHLATGTLGRVLQLLQ